MPGRGGKLFAPVSNEKELAELIPVIIEILAMGILDIVIHRISGRYGQISI
jgi:hypothetical protein